MSDADKRPLQSFANGVSAFIASHSDNLPIEFTILGIKPAPWEPVDTVAWGKVMAYNLGGNYDAELLRASLIEKFGAAKANELMPPYPATGPFTIPPEAKNYQSLITNDKIPIANISIGTPNLSEIAAIDASLGLRDEGVGSNDWVIDGSKSTTGKPILANDPHLGIQMPSIWYEVGLHCVPQSDACPYNVAGYTFPGVPGVVIGHNDRIAWGVTNVGPDVQDLFIEEVNPQNPNQSKFNGKWEDMQIVDEPIKVKNVVSETLHVQITRHGPIMTPVLGSGVTQPLALQWTALRERSRLFESVLEIDRANNWNDFRTALRLWDVPSQNFVYADVDGNIGYQMPGNVPIRAKGDGSVPVSGTGDYEWTGYIPFDELPFVYNPPTHFVATANQAVVPPTYKYWITADWAAPYREQRITDLLKAKDKLSIDDMKTIQGDVYSIPVAQLQKSLVAIAPEGVLQQRAMEYVKSWDGKLTTESVGGTIAAVTLDRLMSNLFTDKLGIDLAESYIGTSDYSRRAALALLDQPNSDWWGPTGRDAVLKKSYADAVDWLGSQFGDAPGDWKWGRLHTATFNHPLGSVQPLDLLFNAGPVAAPGGVNTVFATSYKIVGNRYDVSSVSSLRAIYDLSNFANSLQIHTTGESGQPLDKHYSDMVLLWRDVQYAPMYFDRAALDKVKEGLLVLQP
ncbi:MAG TPA: penicillin acylase family protein, partial [Anaerolineae bacterium]